MYAQHLAWLQTTPKNEGKLKSVAPCEQYESDDPIFVMPQADEFVITCLNDIGITRNVGSGSFPLSHADLAAFVQLTGESLSQDQSALIIHASREYCRAHNEYSSKPLQRPAYDREYTPAEMRKRGEIIQRAMMKGRNNG